MAKAKQYLRVHIGNAVFLLPGASGYAIEQRENLSTADAAAPIVAWRTVRNRRLPAYALDAGLRSAKRDNWQRAVFIESAPGDGAGFVADDVHMLAEEEVTVASFEPLGPPPTPAGHVFGGAWLSDKRVVLVFEPRALVAYLQSLGGV
jgi:hypothetical protein